MGRREKSLTLNKAVKKLAALTDKSWSTLSSEEQAEKLRSFLHFNASLKKKERAKSSRPSRVPPGRRRALARG